MSVRSFRLPDVGEGLTEAEIVTWKVKPGDTVKVNDIVVEIETAKSLVELPVPYAGVVAELLVPEGQTVDVGTPIISVETSVPGGVAKRARRPSRPERSRAPPRSRPLPAEGAIEPGLIGGPAPGGRTSVLVGYGPRTTEAKRRPRKGARRGRAQRGSDPGVTLLAGTVPAEAEDTIEIDAYASSRPLAKPPVRALAKQLGVDLAQVPGTGRQGSVTREDLQSSRTPAQRRRSRTAEARDHLERDHRTGEDRMPIRGVRKLTAEAMVRSAFTAPHVTEFVTVDVTRDDAAGRAAEGRPGVRRRQGVAAGGRGEGAFACGATASDDQRRPGTRRRRRSWSSTTSTSASPRPRRAGWSCPTSRTPDALSLHGLAVELGDLTATAREGRTPPADMTGGTITITNVGVFGVDTGTPILNPGEAAILAFGAVRQQPWVHRGKVQARAGSRPLALSFDHRLVDGELGSRFLADLAAILEHPAQALVWA